MVKNQPPASPVLPGNKRSKGPIKLRANCANCLIISEISLARPKRFEVLTPRIRSLCSVAVRSAQFEGEILSVASSRPSKFGRQHVAHIGLGNPELSRYAGRRDSGLEGGALHLTLCQRDIGLVCLPLFRRFFRCDRWLRRALTCSGAAFGSTSIWNATTGRPFRHACKLQLEGIVSKRRDSSYRSGRSPD